MENGKLSLEHQNNLSHFTAMVYMAQVDGKFKKQELFVLEDFAIQLGISPDEYQHILNHPMRPQIMPSRTTSNRMKRIFSMFKIIYANNKMNRKERLFAYRYTLQIGFSKSNARKVINKSSAMFSGDFDFDAFDGFVKR